MLGRERRAEVPFNRLDNENFTHGANGTLKRPAALETKGVRYIFFFYTDSQFNK